MAVGNSIGNVGFLSPQPLQHRFPQLRQARTCFRTKMSTSTGDSRHAPLTLLSTPVSLFAMRARYIAARKQFPAGTMDIVSPAELGGLKSEQYLAVNPLGKMPALIIRDDPEGTFELFESKVICEYLIDRFPEMKPTFVPTSARGRAIGNLVASLLDSYVGPLNYAMYKPLDPDFDRAAVVKQMDQGFDAIEHVLDSSGPYVAGGDMSIGDIALFASFPFYDFMLPTFFGVHPVNGRPKLKKWHSLFLTESSASKECYMEVWRALEKWMDDGRWENLKMKPLISGKPKPPF